MERLLMHVRPWLSWRMVPSRKARLMVAALAFVIGISAILVVTLGP